MIFFSTPPHHGTLRRYHAHPEAWLHALPDAIETFEEGALLEPLAVALAGIDRSGVRLADPVVICGAGPIGLVTLVAAAAAGAEPIVVTDLDEGRLRKAREVVPRARTLVVGRPGGESARETGERIVGLLGMEARVVLECTGVEGSVHSGVYVSFSLFLSFSLSPLQNCGNPKPNIMIPGNAVRRHGLRHWRRQGYPEYPVHAHVCQADRSALPVPLPRHLPAGHPVGCIRGDRPEAAGVPSVPVGGWIGGVSNRE